MGESVPLARLLTRAPPPRHSGSYQAVDSGGIDPQSLRHGEGKIITCLRNLTAKARLSAPIGDDGEETMAINA